MALICGSFRSSDLARESSISFTNCWRCWGLKDKSIASGGGKQVPAVKKMVSKRMVDFASMVVMLRKPGTVRN